MSIKIQSDKQNKNVFGFHLFKLGVHLFLFLFFNFYSEDTSILIIEKKKKKQGIKLGRYKAHSEHTKIIN